MRAVAVFCGSRMGSDPAFGQAAEALGQGLATRGIRLVYGGGGIGIMGVVARAALRHGGRVTGVIPHFLMELELRHPDLSELVVVDDMHTRKRVMFERSDAFVILPGGLGTLDEAVEIITWRQLARHDKPVFVLSVAGYWDPFRATIDHAVRHGFADPEAAALFSTLETVEDLFSAIEAGYGGGAPSATPQGASSPDAGRRGKDGEAKVWGELPRNAEADGARPRPTPGPG